MPYESRCRPTSPPTTAAPQFSVPVDVASHTGAMQAQEHRIQRWAVATRTRNPSQEALMSCFSQRVVSHEGGEWLRSMNICKYFSQITRGLQVLKISVFRPARKYGFFS